MLKSFGPDDESESDPENAVKKKYSKGKGTLALSNDVTDNEDMLEDLFKDIKEDLKAAGVEDLKAAGVETVEEDDDNVGA